MQLLISPVGSLITSATCGRGGSKEAHQAIAHRSFASSTFDDKRDRVGALVALKAEAREELAAARPPQSRC